MYILLKLKINLDKLLISYKKCTCYYRNDPNNIINNIQHN